MNCVVLKDEVFNGGRQGFKVHLNALVAYYYLANSSCFNANERYNGQTDIGILIRDGLKKVVRSEDYGLYTLVLQFEPMSNFRRSRQPRINKNSDCSKASTGADFDIRLLRMAVGLVNYLDILTDVLEPVFSRCRRMRGKTLEVLANDEEEWEEETSVSSIWTYVMVVLIACLSTGNVVACVVLTRRHRRQKTKPTVRRWTRTGVEMRRHIIYKPNLIGGRGRPRPAVCQSTV